MSAPVRRAVRVQPRAKRPGLQGLREDGVILARVGAPPEDGRANAELCAVLAKALGLRARQVAVVIGHTSRDKVVEIDGLSAGEIDTRLAS
ncbi:MAG: DUF167 domain-containing protein [Solirubrobacteraceae bacterium]|nr:DUF167 domain-containing protein [Solirubrobacteraceae bacterium]